MGGAGKRVKGGNDVNTVRAMREEEELSVRTCGVWLTG